MKLIIFLTFLLVLTLSVAAQDGFQWKGLRLQTGSLNDAVGVLGKPKKDKVEPAKFDKTIPPESRKAVNFRRLEYKNVDDYKEVNLLFLNERLFGIEFTPQKRKVLASDLGKLYNADFLFAEGLPKEINFGNYVGQKETSVPKVYPVVYFMLAAKGDYGILATIDNGSWKAMWRDGIKKPTVETFPGWVSSIHVISRNFEPK